MRKNAPVIKLRDAPDDNAIHPQPALPTAFSNTSDGISTLMKIQKTVMLPTY